MLQIAKGESQWILHDFDWDRAFLERLVQGADSGRTYIDLAAEGVGAGDLCIMTEVSFFKAKVRTPVRIWTLDKALATYGSTTR